MMDETSTPLPEVPGFQLRRRIGRGGSASVYLAEQEGSGFRRDVALKLIDRIVDSAALHRVRDEQRILARLEHPGIARLYDAGLAPTGQPYLAMEHVEGETILDHCRSRALPLRRRLELFLAVLDAVEYAHGEAVVHRDLKPANILVSERGEAKLLDFGIAKLVADPEAEEETLTLRRAMTPAYASPEQVRGDRITPASDVYSLGVVLYELLAETLPYRLDGKRFETYPDAIRGQEPEPASSAFARVAATENSATSVEMRPSGSSGNGASSSGGRRARERLEQRSSRQWRRALRGDLDAVLLKTLRKEPEARYASASDLAADLRLYLAGRPVTALRGTLAYRASRFLRRHRVAVWSGAAAALALLALAAGPQIRTRLWGEGEARRRELALYRDARPDHAEAKRLLRSGAEQLARYDALAAREPFSRAASRFPALAVAWDGLARAESEIGEIGRSNAAALRADSVRGAPGNDLEPEESERLRIRALAAGERWKEALPAARSLLRRLPGRIDVGLDLVTALIRSGRTEEASRLLARLHALPSQRRAADPRLDTAEAEVAIRLGEFQRGAAAADRARVRSLALRSLPLQLRAERLHGEAIARLDQRAEARRELEAVVARDEAAALPGEAAATRLALGTLLLRVAGNDEARNVLERARDGLRAAGDRHGELLALSQLAVLGGKRGELEVGIRGLLAVVANARRLGDRYAEGTALSLLLVLYNWADRGPDVDALVDPTLTALRESGNRPVLLAALANSAITAIERLELDRAEAYVNEAEGLSSRVGSLLASASVDRARGYLEQTRGDDDLARQRYARAAEKARRTGVWLALGSYLSDLAWLELANDHPQPAEARAREAMAAFEQGGDPRLANATSLVLAWTDAMKGDAKGAERRLDETRRALETSGDDSGHFGLITTEAKVAEALHDWPRAIARRRESIRMAIEWQTPGLVMDQKIGLARALAGAGKGEELEALRRQLLPEMAQRGLHGRAKEVRNLVAAGG